MAACCDRALSRQDDGSAAEVSGQAAEYLRLAVWLAMLVAGWLLQKGLCEAGWPDDCASDCDEQFSWGWSCVGDGGGRGGLWVCLIYCLLYVVFLLFSGCWGGGGGVTQANRSCPPEPI